jgi:hypothetical protein
MFDLLKQDNRYREKYQLKLMLGIFKRKSYRAFFDQQAVLPIPVPVADNLVAVSQRPPMEEESKVAIVPEVNLVPVKSRRKKATSKLYDSE